MNPDFKFNECMTRMKLRGLSFADTPVPEFKRCSGLPHGYFKRTIVEVLRSWMGW